MKSGIIARPGDQVTCPECGTVLYRVRNVLIRHSVIRAADFASANPEMPKPVATKDMVPCCGCGARWWRMVKDESARLERFQMHFSDGWRPHGKEKEHATG